MAKLDKQIKGAVSKASKGSGKKRKGTGAGKKGGKSGGGIEGKVRKALK